MRSQPLKWHYLQLTTKCTADLSIAAYLGTLQLRPQTYFFVNSLKNEWKLYMSQGRAFLLNVLKIHRPTARQQIPLRVGALIVVGSLVSDPHDISNAITRSPSPPAVSAVAPNHMIWILVCVQDLILKIPTMSTIRTKFSESQKPQRKICNFLKLPTILLFLAVLWRWRRIRPWRTHRTKRTIANKI